jgi:hypothetical protein
MRTGKRRRTRTTTTMRSKRPQPAPGLLSDFDFGIAYGPRNDLVNEFYVPALSRAVRYDRSAGFFSSSALAVAAAGVARLIQNDGKMRLLVGAQLSESDAHALRGDANLAEIVAARMLGDLEEAADAIAQERLAALAWMVREGTLDIRVVLPVGADGKPLPASVTRDYYHPKSGLFTDGAGNAVGFSGSINESEQAWIHNYEQLMVFCSWIDGHRGHLETVRSHFEELWNGSLGDWIAMDVPRAVREELLRIAPTERPTRDPRERETPPGPPPAQLDDERVLFQFLRDAPHMPSATRLGETVVAVGLWPHQKRVVDAVVSQYPRRFLLCDEVGLGKTLEAGGIVKQLTLSGRAKRVLILAPRSVCRQWQEEMYEKFVLNVLFYDGDKFIDYHRNECPAGATNPWNEYPLVLASSQLAKRRERTREILAAEPWDLVLVDEAHHARRKDFLSGLYRRNRLLSLLLGEQSEEGATGLAAQTRGLVLLTATPMQVDPREVWDLLTVLGLGGRWGASEADFVRYFNELRKERDANWPFIVAMLRDYFSQGGRISETFASASVEKIGPVGWDTIRTLSDTYKIDATVLRLSDRELAVLIEFARRHTPLAQYLFRNTRMLLREYQRRGLLGNEKVPSRLPESAWITMRQDEAQLYARIEEYISDFYRKYEEERKGLGFVMTVYRRRLTSSFYAIRCSLERRLEFLRGHAIDPGLTDEDIEDADLSADVVDEGDLDSVPALYREEATYVEDFIADLRRLTGDSKVERLLVDLQELLAKRETVLVFTVYADTMDHLRDALREVYGSQVACYSGRGGEIWDGTSWQVVPKEEIKKAFREERVKILLGTEAMSEGLNLQTCGMMINYDMPWNPMRVEQRIGRIDRIGQRYDEVWIRNYFYEDTVEAKVYRALEGRIRWFQEVIGELQPILARIERIIRNAALAGSDTREMAIEGAVEELIAEIDRREIAALNLDEAIEEAIQAQSEPEPVLTLRDVEALMVGSRTHRGSFLPHGEIVGAYVLRRRHEEYGVTFDPEVFDRHPSSLRLLTYGEPLFEELLAEVPEPESMPPAVVRLRDRSTGLRAWYVADDSAGARIVDSLESLRTQAAETAKGAGALQPAAEADFEDRVKAIEERLRTALDQQERASATRVVEQLKDLLRQAACLEIARLAQGALFMQEVPAFRFGEDALERLQGRGYPFAPALRLARKPDLAPTDPYLVEIMAMSFVLREKEHERVTRQIAELLPEVKEATDRLAGRVDGGSDRDDRVRIRGGERVR